MRVLDMDLDFFLNQVEYCASGKRLDGRVFRPWESQRLRTFLIEQCGLGSDHRLRAKLVERHHEVFYHWRESGAARGPEGPLSIVHVDAHADLGLGDASFHYIQTELLHLPIEERANPKVGDGDGLAEGNYLAFAVACRWVRDLTYVHHPLVRVGSDLPALVFKDNDPKTRTIQLKKYPRDAGDLTGFFGERPSPLEVEPEVPLVVLAGADFRETDPFDFAYLAKSPGYTPATADRLIQVFEEFLQFT